ncbi:DEAD/DEAH box helicase family protein [Bacillus mycoides]|uniref:DEAD/DEAH box helicase family protein n=1 Tax=Bacillus mycoides TaxID=1405 RepID=UPI00187934C2|nr:DEAD/DEAH box helicase family protein [Bacillus mycoides]MBE7124570.1 hypothetical protein [Bacillus mycoides]
MEHAQNSLVRKPAPLQVKIIDSIMGTGKTSWAIQHMNEAPLYQKFIYITPFKSEIERVLKATQRDFVQPEEIKGGTKLASLKNLITNGENIVSTHELFKRMDSELIELIEMQGYTLILDEVVNVIDQVKISKSDLGILLRGTTENGKPTVTIDEKGFVHWNEESYEDGIFTKIRNLAKAGNLMIYENTAMYWLFPVSAFKGFEEVYVLTYMFQGQIQRYYYDLFNVNYSYHSVGNNDGRYELIPYIPLREENKEHLKGLINIFYSTVRDKTDLNKMGKGRHAFSKSFVEKIAANTRQKKIVKQNAYNFYRHKCQASTEDVMWTTFKDCKKQLQPTGLKEQFVSVTARATNDYAHKSVCVYLANMFMNPITKKFFTSKNVTVNEDLFALSELLQWVFRSRVRKGEEIHLYIPSERMRTLLERYLSNETIG